MVATTQAQGALAVASAKVCSTGDLADGGVLRAVVGGVPVAVARVGDDWFAINDVCSHREVSLADGEVDTVACELVCPVHGSPFSLVTGEPTAPPAFEPVATYGVHVDGDDVVVTV